MKLAEIDMVKDSKQIAVLVILFFNKLEEQEAIFVIHDM
jgi:hypothetical protein